MESAKLEVPEYTGGVNGLEAASTEVPAYVGGVNSAEAAIHEVSEYKGEQSIVVQAMAQDKTYQAPAAHQQLLPETGSEAVAPLASLGFVGMLLGIFAMGKKKEDQ
ncbi:SIALI-17 repeat-containing surface protein [Streptococcus sp. BJSWXB3CM3]|uniref:SIALI-17 repeat-containing surface protein n=1 Tax=Streptococcus sp. BJSWXB3CM3 TaxID=3095080 RepID=UPI0039BF4D97